MARDIFAADPSVWEFPSRSRRAAVPAACYCSPMNTKTPYYRIYLLTVWQEQSRGPPEQISWRFRLEDPRTGRQHAFADAATLMKASQAITTEAAAAERQTRTEA